MKFVCSLISVGDIAVSRFFYENILKQKVKTDYGVNVTFEGGFSIHLENHFCGLLGPGHDIRHGSNDFELYFECNDIDEVQDELKRHDIAFIHMIREQPWLQRVMRVYDPDRHIIEIGESLEGLTLRLHAGGMTAEEINKRTSLPPEFINGVIDTGRR